MYKLMAPKHISEFTPEEYKQYVKDLNFHPPKKKSKSVKKKRALAPLVWRLNKKGTLILKINRTPKWISREEIAQIAKDSGIEERLIYIKIGAKNSKIAISTEEAESKARKESEEIPW